MGRRLTSSEASTVSEHEGGTPPSHSHRAKVTSPVRQSAWKATKSWMGDKGRYRGGIGEM